MKFNGRPVAYACRVNGHYQIEGDAWIEDAIRDGLLQPVYQLDVDNDPAYIDLMLGPCVLSPAVTSVNTNDPHPDPI